MQNRIIHVRNKSLPLSPGLLNLLCWLSFFCLVPYLFRYIDSGTLWEIGFQQESCKEGPEPALLWVQFSSVTQLCLTLCDPMDCSTPGFPSPTLEACSDSCSSSWWCHPTISSSVIPFSCLQSFLASGSFPVRQFFTSGGQSIGVSASASVLPMNIQDWFPLRLTCWISIQSKGHSRVFSTTTVQKHQFYGIQLSL